MQVLERDTEPRAYDIETIHKISLQDTLNSPFKKKKKKNPVTSSNNFQVTISPSASRTFCSQEVLQEQSITETFQQPWQVCKHFHPYM